ncbi:MAG: hypothetical protein U0228_10535 [Myxococcaceae bacterium]
MAIVRLLLNFMVAGALLGVLVVSLIGPKYIAWDNTPGSGASAMCICQEVARQGADRMVSYQMSGCAAGAVFGALLGGVFVFMRRKAQVQQPAPPAS